MKKILFSLLILIGICPFVQAQDFAGLSSAWSASSTPLPAVSGGGGPNAWYYTCTVTPLVEPAWTTGYYSVMDMTLGTITIPAGTITKFGTKGAENYTENTAFALYDTAAEPAILTGSCVSTALVDGSWAECTLSVPVAIGAGTYYIAMDGDQNNHVKHLGSGVYKRVNTGYAVFPLTPKVNTGVYTITSYTNDCVAMGIFVQ